MRTSNTLHLTGHWSGAVLIWCKPDGLLRQLPVPGGRMGRSSVLRGQFQSSGVETPSEARRRGELSPVSGQCLEVMENGTNSIPFCKVETHSQDSKASHNVQKEKKNPEFAPKGLKRSSSAAVGLGWRGGRYGCGDRMLRDKAFIQMENSPSSLLGLNFLGLENFQSFSR